VWLENDPWRAVIGSDSPAFAMYEDGQVIFLKEDETGEPGYFSVMLSQEEQTRFLKTLAIDEDFFALETFYSAAEMTDQPNHTLLVSDGVALKRVQVYGDIRGELEARLAAPKPFWELVEQLSTYDHEQATTWTPQKVEVMIWPYDTSEAMPWPEDWPDLDHPTTWYRGDDNYSIYLDWPRFEGLRQRLQQETPGALLINGKSWAYSYRYPFINEHLWLHNARLNAPAIPTPTPQPVVVLDETTIVIFPANTVTGWNNSWTPTPEQIQTLEAALIPFLKSADDPWLKPDPPIWERLPNYKRQYLGLVEDGQLIIYGNFFCRVDRQDWQSALIEVEDGGDCYFQIKYDVETETIYSLSVNGEA
jgi:hypothetical protein